MNIMDWVNQIYLEEICLAIAGAIIGGVAVVYYQIFKRLTPVKEETEPEDDYDEFPAEKISEEIYDLRLDAMFAVAHHFRKELLSPLFQEALDEGEKKSIDFAYQFEPSRRLLLVRVLSQNSGFPKGDSSLAYTVDLILKRLGAPFEVVGRAEPCKDTDEEGQQIKLRMTDK